jgi:5'-nucleotidase
MRLLIDMDSVTVELMPYWLNLYNQEYGESLTKEQITDWNLERIAKRGNVILDYLERPGFFLNPPPVTGAIEYITKLKGDGHDVVFVTTCQAGHTDKLAWLKKHFLSHNHRHVIFATRKELVLGDVLLDDGPHNLNHPHALNVCFDQPWNRHVETDHRVHSWPDFYQLIQNLEITQEKPSRFLKQNLNLTQKKPRAEANHNPGGNQDE